MPRFAQMVCFLASLPPAAQSMSCLPSSALFATKAALWAPTPSSTSSNPSCPIVSNSSPVTFVPTTTSLSITTSTRFLRLPPPCASSTLVQALTRLPVTALPILLFLLVRTILPIVRLPLALPILRPLLRPSLRSISRTATSRLKRKSVAAPSDSACSVAKKVIPPQTVPRNPSNQKPTTTTTTTKRNTPPFSPPTSSLSRFLSRSMEFQPLPSSIPVPLVPCPVPPLLKSTSFLWVLLRLFHASTPSTTLLSPSRV
ncbi:hypothetical protein CAOG_09038 [Capsaspora owczarzaki ATCC 30864]|uniref:hypothetical protein n=1 Tax=Capsaspora owczarzaki (strain ATCC 30864) TaxID=595528 RepID=UPI0003525D3C|nr:hypothetical protein CAOG_09038 [Capsaspora owczarzaki ATCC 30864]|eukprot:XP_011270726.1 hypothetical protein CAOG_09038 [Capsaspora owczarzaki ATCC 30864]